VSLRDAAPVLDVWPYSRLSPLPALPIAAVDAAAAATGGAAAAAAETDIAPLAAQEFTQTLPAAPAAAAVAEGTASRPPPPSSLPVLPSDASVGRVSVFVRGRVYELRVRIPLLPILRR
jgi:hypothetical protein